MPIITTDELWSQLRKENNVNSNLDVLIEMEKKAPGMFEKVLQNALHPKMLYQYTTIQSLAMILST